MTSVIPIILFTSDCNPLLRQAQLPDCYQWVECPSTDAILAQIQKKSRIAAVILDEATVLDGGGGELIRKISSLSPRSTVLLTTRPNSPIKCIEKANVEFLDTGSLGELHERVKRSAERYSKEEQADIRDCLARR